MTGAGVVRSLRTGSSVGCFKACILEVVDSAINQRAMKKGQKKRNLKGIVNVPVGIGTAHLNPSQN